MPKFKVGDKVKFGGTTPVCEVLFIGDSHYFYKASYSDGRQYEGSCYHDSFDKTYSLYTEPEKDIEILEAFGFVFKPSLYRITPVEEGRFQIERAYSNDPDHFFTVKAFGVYNDTTKFFDSSTEAEEYIRNQIERDYEYQLKEYNKKQWIKNNPPYEYNPYPDWSK